MEKEEKNEIKAEVVGKEEEVRKIVLTDEEKENYKKADDILNGMDSAILMATERLDKVQRDLSSLLEEKRKYINEQNVFFSSILEKYFIKAENMQSFDVKEGIIIEKIVKEEPKKEEIKEDSNKELPQEATNE